MPSEHSAPAGSSEKVLGDHLSPSLTHLQQTLGYFDVALKLGEHWNSGPAQGAEATGSIGLCGFAKPLTSLQGSGFWRDTLGFSECAEA